jgi:hypothetical protein
VPQHGSPSIYPPTPRATVHLGSVLPAPPSRPLVCSLPASVTYGTITFRCLQLGERKQHLDLEISRASQWPYGIKVAIKPYEGEFSHSHRLLRERQPRQPTHGGPLVAPAHYGLHHAYQASAYVLVKATEAQGSAKIPRPHATQALCGFLDLKPRQRRAAHIRLFAYHRAQRGTLAFASALRVPLACCFLWYPLVSSVPSVPCGGDPVGTCWKDAYMLSRYRLRLRGSKGLFLVLLFPSCLVFRPLLFLLIRQSTARCT